MPTLLENALLGFPLRHCYVRWQSQQGADGIMADVRAICAIGQRGQIGLNGELPWEGNPGPRVRCRCRTLLRGDARPRHARRGPHHLHPAPLHAIRPHAMRRAVHRSPRRRSPFLRPCAIYVAGGPAVWEAYAGFIRHWDINRLPYDGPVIAGSSRNGWSRHAEAPSREIQKPKQCFQRTSCFRSLRF